MKLCILQHFKHLCTLNKTLETENMTHIEEIRDELETLKEIILEKVPTDQIWLFGSYAYGKSQNYDFKVIYLINMIFIIHSYHKNHKNHSSDDMKDDAQMRELDAMSEVHGGMFDRRMMKPADILAIKRNRFDYRAENFSMENKIKREGVKIYG